MKAENHFRNILTWLHSSHYLSTSEATATDPTWADPSRYGPTDLLNCEQHVNESPGVVVGFAVIAAGYSSMRHFMVDKTIRLKRQNRAADAHEEHHEEH